MSDRENELEDALRECLTCLGQAVMPGRAEALARGWTLLCGEDRRGAPKPERAKVYLVWSGEYSNYGIDAVYTTREGADACAARNDAVGRESTGVDEYWLDEDMPLDPCWQVAWRIATDEKGEKHVPGTLNVDVECVIETGALGVHREDAYFGRGGVVLSTLYVRAADEATAIKVASERRAAFLATKGVTLPLGAAPRRGAPVCFPLAAERECWRLRERAAVVREPRRKASVR